MANQTTPNTPAPLSDLVLSNRDKILSVAIPSIVKNSDVWLKRSIVEVSQNKELSDFVLGAGKTQFITKLAKAAQVGLQIGGTKPHAYFVNMGGQLRMDITKEGLGHVCVFGPGAVLEHVPQIIEVKKKDLAGFQINQAEGTYKHDFNPFDPDRGETVGWYCVLNYKNGVKEIQHITLDKVKKIRDGYSQVNSPAWKKSESEMLEKIATKQLLKKPFAMSEGLAMLVDALDVDGIDDTPPEPKDISDRAETRIDDAIGNLGEGNEIEPPPAKKEKVVNEKPKADLF